MFNFGEGSPARPATPASRVAGGGRRRQAATTTIATTSSATSCSQQSVLSAIDRFVKSVDGMDAAVLVPSRLRDMEIQGRRKSGPPPPPGLQNHQDLYSFYAMLKDVKNELLWGPTSSPLFPGTPSGMSSMSSGMSSVSSMSGMSSVSSMSSMSSGMSSPRRPTPMASMMGMGMMGMMTAPRGQSSDDGLGSSTGSDQDTDSDFESIVADRESMILEQTSHLSTAFRHHLHGLHAILHQLADSADYLSSRYQEEVENPMA